MTKKDYILIAKAIANASLSTASPNHLAGIELVTEYLSIRLKHDNPNFDHGRFIKYIKDLIKESS